MNGISVIYLKGVCPDSLTVNTVYTVDKSKPIVSSDAQIGESSS